MRITIWTILRHGIFGFPENLWNQRRHDHVTGRGLCSSSVRVQSGDAQARNYARKSGRWIRGLQAARVSGKSDLKRITFGLVVSLVFLCTEFPNTDVAETNRRHMCLQDNRTPIARCRIGCSFC